MYGKITGLARDGDSLVIHYDHKGLAYITPTGEGLNIDYHGQQRSAMVTIRFTLAGARDSLLVCLVAANSCWMPPGMA